MAVFCVFHVPNNNVIKAFLRTPIFNGWTKTIKVSMPMPIQIIDVTCSCEMG